MPLAKRTILAVYGILTVLIVVAACMHYWQRYTCTRLAQRRAQILATPIHELVLHKKRLDESLTQLSRAAGVTVERDARNLEDAGIDADTPVDIAIFDLPLKTALDVLASSAGGQTRLSWTWRGDTLVLITADEADNSVTTRLIRARRRSNSASNLSMMWSGWSPSPLNRNHGEKPVGWLAPLPWPMGSSTSFIRRECSVRFRSYSTGSARVGTNDGPNP